MPRNAAVLDIKGGKTQTIAFGLVNVPIKIKNVKAPKKSRSISGSFVCAEHHEKARQTYVCDCDGMTHKAGEACEKVTGYQVADGSYVVPDQDVLEQIIAEKTGAIAIDAFVPAADVDPLFFNESYIVAPGEGGGPTYDLLAQAMADANMVAWGKAVLPGTKKTQGVIIRWSPFAEQLVLETCKFDTDINWDDLDAVSNGIKARPAPAKANLDMAAQIIDGLTAKFDPTTVEDEYDKAKRDLVAQLAGGKKLTAPAPKVEAATPADDLVAQLKKSVAASKKPAAKTTKKKEVAA